MSKMEIKAALERIEYATPISPLIVLSCGYDNCVQCSFANTVEAHRIVKSKEANLIGIFDGTMDLDEVAQLIKGRVKADYLAARDFDVS
ncbi:MAG: hypothetical protein RL755_1438 [Pseudomonadota bacterium]|jgi:hypothetical protein